MIEVLETPKNKLKINKYKIRCNCGCEYCGRGFFVDESMYKFGETNE